MLVLMLTEAHGFNLWDAILKSGAFVKGILVVLIAFSILSWVIIVQKSILLNRCKAVSLAFRQAFKRATDWKEFKNQVEHYGVSPHLGLFMAGYGEVTYQLRASAAQAVNRAQLKSMEAVERSLQRASVVEMGRLERSLGILATIAATSPFIGLLGTVWGIIDAFQGIGATGNASLATVAPGIAEALFATAVGLLAAIPALIAYNFFQGQLKNWQTELDDYALEFISLTERNFT